MIPDISAGSVVAYSYRSVACEAIVHSVSGDKVWVITARQVDTAWPDYRKEPQGLHEDVHDLRLHPDADAVWASFVAGLLSSAS